MESDCSAAHMMRDQSSSRFKAVQALKAERRWAVTGTPIQNRLTDLLSLFAFLHYHPFDQSKVFHRHVTERWKAHSDPAAIASLKVLVNSITLRRPKRVIHLPQKTEEVRYLSFSNEEREHYERTKLITLRKFDSIERVSSTSSFVNALQWINGLRLICNHGLNYNPNSETGMSTSHSASLTWNREAAEDCFEQLCHAGLAFCSACQTDLSQVSNDVLDCAGDRRDHPWLAQSLGLLCAPCFLSGGHGHGYQSICNHPGRYRCLSDTRPDQISPPRMTSTKVDALLQDLLSLRKGQKRLFSIIQKFTAFADTIAALCFHIGRKLWISFNRC
jgi:SWI/SNF-related matrix-associated actin-dependent regulator of chromatin subfamily A3